MASTATSSSPPPARSSRATPRAKAGARGKAAAPVKPAKPATAARAKAPDAAIAGDEPLARYRAKRDFTVTSEPGPVRTKAAKQLSFVIQKHDATRLHYDFRLELDGVLLSWAVPKGPSFDPKARRLAVHVEDHPVAYGAFEGTIPKGQYGAGTVIVWDNGTWEPIGDPRAGMRAGKLVFRLHGRKLAGLWELVKIAKPGERQEPWLLFKKHDEWERSAATYDVVTALPDSVIATPLKPLEASPADAAAPMPAKRANPARGDKAAALTRGEASALQAVEDVQEPEDVPAAATPKSRARADATRRAPKKTARSPSRPASAFDVSSLAGAVEARLPDTLSPQLATLSKTVPVDDGWIFEIKFDGYRLMTHLADGHAVIVTRGGHDWTHKLQPLADELAALGLADAWLDGEAVVFDGDGRPSFNGLQKALDGSRVDDIVYYLFDIPFANGHDLRDVPLHARRALLREIVDAHAGDRIRFSDDFPAAAAKVLETACDMQLEGVIAKRRDGAYTSARSTDWLKLKCQARQEFVIGGFSDRSDNARAVGALMLGYYDDGGEFRYAGRVGTGWSSADAVALRTKLAKLEAKASPFPVGTTRSTRWLVRPAAEDHWVKPALVAEIAFAEWTPDGSVRHASFQGLREDKPARSVRRELAKAPPARTAAAGTDDAADDSPPPARGRRARARPEPETTMPSSPVTRAATTARTRSATTATATAKAHTPSASTSAPKPRGKDRAADVDGVRVTHPDRVVDASTGHTKLDVARYYASIADWMLPHLKARPASLVRAPEGVAGELFFQKHADVRTMPGVVQLPDLWEGHGPLLEVPSARALVAAAQMNVIEFHTWNSVKRKIDKPDRMIFDLDPGEGVPFAQVREGAQLMRALLEELGLRCWLKTSGGKGLHVVVPMTARLDYDTVKSFSQAIVQHLARTIPQRFVAKSGPSNRVGKIFVDYLRNGFNATTAAAFSARARPGLGVSMPVSWDELDELKGGAHWTIATARDRMSFQKVDPWAEYWACRQTMTAAMKALRGVDGAD